MRRTIFLAAAAAATVGFIAGHFQTAALAHCQVPCGIYDDSMRITMLREDATTIRKAITSMEGLMQDQGHPLHGFNQGVRWISEKDETATNVQRVVSDYFLTQRVKSVPQGSPGHDAYLEQLTRMHAILVAAMKCKQNADMESVDALDGAIDAIASYYPPSNDEG